MMVKVRFLVDYRGILTKEQYFTAGAEVEFPEGIAEALVAEERAELVKPPVKRRTRRKTAARSKK